MTSESKPVILFLCTGNSCRSQMAEGWARDMHADRYQVVSAGIEAHGLNPRAVAVMKEAGVDISRQQSQRLEELADANFDAIVTVCGHADENCPTVPVGCLKLYVPFDDPPSLAREMASEEEVLECYRRVRDEIREMIQCLPEKLANREGK